MKKLVRARLRDLISQNATLGSGLAIGDLDLFCEIVIFEQYRENETIFYAGDDAHNIFIILEGCVKLCSQAPSGKESITSFSDRGSLIGAESLNSNQNWYHLSAVVIQDCWVAKISMNQLTSAMQKMQDSASVLLAISNLMQNHINQLTAKVEHLTMMSAPERLGCFIMRQFNANKNTAMEVILSCSKSHLSMRLGMSAETLSRALDSLRKSSFIDVQGRSVIIKDYQELSKYSCTNCSAIRSKCAPKIKNYL